MQKKHILVLSLLAAGIAIELILMAGFVTVRGNSEQTLSTNSTSIAWGEKTKNSTENGVSATGEAADLSLLPPEGDPLLDPDMLGAAPGMDLTAEATPIFSTTDEVWFDSSGSTGYDLPNYGSGSSGGALDPYDFPQESYPVPPTQPAGPLDPLPTDVPAATEPAPTSTGPAPTPTIPWQPVPSNTVPAPTQPPAQPTQPPAQPTQPPAQPTQPPAQPTQPPAQPTQAPTSAPAGLVSVKADAPSVDGAGSDAAWAAAPALEIDVSGGANNGATRITARSVYSGDSVYFLFTWADPTHSYLRFPWEKQADGSWKLLESPNNGLNDENVYYEDKLALLWPMRGMDNFNSAGCGTACHSGENADVKPYGNMYAPEGGRADLWQWKSARNAGQLDDEYLDDTRYSADSPAAGVHPDPNDGGGYRSNENKDGSAPAYMPPNGGQKNGAPGYITEAKKMELDASLFNAGERVPSVLVAPWQGDRGDIQAAWSYGSGVWTLELRRKLVTGSSYDVQFDDPDKVYSFGIAAFDNAQVRHAYPAGAVFFRFQQ